MKDKVEMNFKEIECESGDRNHLAESEDQWRVLVDMVMNLSVW